MAQLAPRRSHVDAAARLAAAFASPGSDDVVFAALHDVLASFGTRRLTIAALTNEPNDPVRFHYHADRADSKHDRLDPATLTAALAADEPRFLPPANGEPGARLPYAMTCPMRTAGRTVGICVAQSESPFNDSDLELLDVAGTLVAQRLTLSREQAAVAAKGRAVELLLHAARALSTELDLAQLFAKFHALVGRVMDASIFFAALLTPDGESLEIQYLSEFGKRAAEKTILPGSSLSGRVVRSGEAVLANTPEEGDAHRAQMLPETYDSPSLIIAPIKLGAHVLGVLSVQSARANAYSEQDRDLLVAVSEQAALAVENLRNLRASTQRAADLNLLVEVANAVSSELDLRRVFSKIYAQVRRVLDASLFYVALASDEEEAVRLEYLVEGDKVFQATSYASSGTIVGTVIQSAAPVLVRNAEERDRLTSRAIGVGPTTVQSVIAVPMRIGGRVIGALSVQSYEADAYNDRHVELLQAIADQSAVAVQNARLYEQARVLADNDALTGLPHHRTIQERLSAELKRAHRQGTKIALCMMDVDNFKIFNDAYGHPAGDRALKHVARTLREVARGEDIVGRYGGDEFCAILIDADRSAAEKFVGRLNTELARRPVSIGSRQEVFLTLSIGMAVYPHDRLHRDELIAAADAELYMRKRGDRPTLSAREEKVALLTGDLDRFSSLVSALTNSNRFMREHVFHMNTLAAVYAAFAEMKEDETKSLIRSATFGDVGMLSIPSGLLSKPGRLKKAEYDVVKSHARSGYDLLRLMEGCADIADAVLHHHERFDGSGYPDSLAGNKIPKMSRILAVLDAYAAMTCDRPYRRALTRDDAVRELRANSGSQFDPEVVETFLKALGP